MSSQFSWTCDQCSKVITHQKSVSRHKLSHTSTGFTCPDCGKIFSRQESVVRHIADASCKKGQSEPNQCEICEKSFTHHWRLKRHLKIHDDAGTYKCGHCAKEIPISQSANHNYYCSQKEGDFNAEYASMAMPSTRLNCINNCFHVEIRRS